MAAIVWTKEWSSADDGTIVSGFDLANIQSDIGIGVSVNATSIQGVPVDAPEAVDDDRVIFYDHSNLKFDYVDIVAPIPLTYLDTDSALAADSDTKVASQKATKAYADAIVTGAAALTTYDSGWFAVATGNSYEKTHSLGTTKVMLNILFSPNSDGTGICTAFPFGEFAMHDASANTAGLLLAELTTTTLRVNTGSARICTTNSTTGSTETQHASGYARVIALALE